MRVTQQQIINNFIRNINGHNNKLLDVNNKISSGKAVEKPQDGSIAAAAIVRLQARISETAQFRENILQSLSKLNTIDSTLGDVSDILKRARELAVQGANGTLSLDERDAIATEVNQLLESMVQIGNMTVGGSTVFGGHETLGQPFDVVRGSDLGEVRDTVTIHGEVRKDINVGNITRVVYNGDAQKSSIEVDQNLAVDYNITGRDLFYYDQLLNNSGPTLGAKQVGITEKTALVDIENVKGSLGIASGLVTVRNTRGLHLKENTNPGYPANPALDNSTRLALLNNSIGVNTATANITITDSAGNNLVINAVPAFTRVQETVDFLNNQTNPTAVKVRFRVENNQIKLYDTAGGTGNASVVDNGASTFARDLNLTGANPDFSALGFSETTRIADWIGEADITSLTLGNISLRDSSGVEVLVNTAGLNATSTVGDLMSLINNSNSRISVGISNHGYGLTFRDNANGSGNFFIQDTGASTLVSGLGFKTPPRGSQGLLDTGSQRLVDLTSIGDTVKTVGEMLTEINRQTADIGVEARLDATTSQIVFEDIRIPAERGKYRVSVSNAISEKTALGVLNEGGGVNNFKLSLTDSLGITQEIDFEGATTIEDVINAINLKYEPITERTHLRNLEGISFPLGTINVTSSAGSMQIDLSTIPGTITQPITAAAAANETTVRDMRDFLRTQLANIQMDADIVLDAQTGGLAFKFTDLTLGDGTVGISDASGASASQFKMQTLGVGREFVTGSILHKRVAIRASLNDDRTGLKLTDLNGGTMTINEVQGRTTAFDLGLVPAGVTTATSNTLGILRGADLRVFNRPADDLGVATAFSTKRFAAENILNAGTGLGATDNRYIQTRSQTLLTRSLSTLHGSVDLNPKLHTRLPLSLLNNASANPEYLGNRISNVDLTGTIRIRLAIDQDNAATAGDTANRDELELNLNLLPDNPSWGDLQRLIDEQTAVDTSFPARIKIEPTADGSMNFISDIPFQMEEVAASAGASTIENLFGSNTAQEYSYVHKTQFLGVKKPMTGGVSMDNFYFDEVGGLASFEVDLQRIARQKFSTRSEIELGDLISDIQLRASAPKELTTTTRLKDLNIPLPFTQAPFTGANQLTDASTLGDFLTTFNASGFGFTLAIADTTNAPTDMDKKALVALPGALGPYNATAFNTKEMSQFLDHLGVQLSGNATLNGTPGANGKVGRQISGLGFDVKVSIDELGKLRIDSSGSRIRVREGRGTTATDLKIIEGTGALGDGTRIIHSGNLTPGVRMDGLMSELLPNYDGLRTNFMTALKDLYVENGKDSAFVQLADTVPITMETPFKAFNSGVFDVVNGLYDGGVDVGRRNSGFIIKDQFGNSAFVDLSNNQSTTANNSQANLEKQFTNKPFYDRNMTLEDLQAAIDIGLAKARLDPANTGFGVDEISVTLTPDGGYALEVSGQNGPTITISDFADSTGKALSTTAKDLGLLREVGARGNGSPLVTAGPIRMEPTMNYLIQAVNRDLSTAGVTMTLGTSAQGPTLDITSNTDSVYMKVRDSREGNTASQVGLTATRSVFQTLIDLRDSLQRDDADFITSELIARIGQDEEKVLQYRARVGSVVNRFETNVERLEITKIELTKRLSENQDINMTDAIIQLRQSENAQTASLNVGARIIQQTLLNFLR